MSWEEGNKITQKFNVVARSRNKEMLRYKQLNVRIKKLRKEDFQVYEYQEML